MRQSDKLASRILWGMLIGIVAGILARWGSGYSPELKRYLLLFNLHLLEPFGQIFLRLLFFVVVPLVFASLALGIVQLGNLEKLGRMAGKTFLLFFVNMAIGVGLGLLMMNLLEPGARMDESVRTELLSQFAGEARTQQERAAAQPEFNLNFLVEIFLPRNLFKSVVDFQILPLIVFALLIGMAGTLLPEKNRASLSGTLDLIVTLMTHIVNFALRLAPYAVPALIFGVVLKSGFEFLQSLLLFVAGVLGVMILHLFGTMSLILKLFSSVSPLAFFNAIRTILITAFSTSSSNATLPTTIQVSREKLGVSAETAGFVLPLGATMNMSGTALYEGCVVLFIAQVYGVDLNLGQQLLLLLLSVLSAVAVAGIPGASLPLIVGLLASFKIPPEGIALIIGADRLLDMARTTVNVGADVVTAVVVDEGLRQKSPAESPP